MIFNEENLLYTVLKQGQARFQEGGGNQSNLFVKRVKGTLNQGKLALDRT